MEEKSEEKEMPAKTLLIAADRYLKTGAHIGTRYKTGEMKRYIYKQRPDGLKVLDVQTLDNRIKTAAKMISQYPVEKVVVISRKLYGQQSVEAFAKAVGAKAIAGRFVPGTFTNPKSKTFTEPKLLMATESDSDFQAIEEAAKIKIPVIALCSTNNTTKNVDLVIPVNNKGRKSLALVYWLVAREILKEKGAIKKDDEFKEKIEDFEYQLTGAEIEEEEKHRLEKKRFPQGRAPMGRGRPGQRAGGGKTGRRPRKGKK